ncbi:MAG: hypothetical protein YK1309IOTA_1360002 [Marine Group I thaumarchaeote]|nr:MAG: hypothetical protein YK1309IOTA_1360002 [Marine Group I thaumarchaeote]
MVLDSNQSGKNTDGYTDQWTFGLGIFVWFLRDCYPISNPYFNSNY